MRLKFSILLILCTLIGRAQNDTVIYYSKLFKAGVSKNEAFYYCEVKKGKKGNYTLREFALVDNKWKKVYEGSMNKETDSTFSFFQISNKKQIYIRSITKKDSGFYIRDNLNSRLYEEGLSKTIFPLIKNGPWRHYNSVDGKIFIEAEYKDNQLITNKYWNPDGTYINDVFSYVDKYPEYEGGDYELLNFVAQNTRYPEKAKDNNITGRVILSFVVMKDGSIQGIRFVQRVNFLLDVEALRVVNSIPPNKWKPAEIGNKKVNMPVMIPINFSIH
jgi:TonB family protein